MTTITSVLDRFECSFDILSINNVNETAVVTDSRTIIPLTPAKPSTVSLF